MSVAQYGQTCQSDSSGCPHDGHACLSRVVQTGQTRYDASTRARHTGQRWSSWREPLLHRLDLELALARVLEVLGRAEEHVDDRPEERREEADERREPDEPRIRDPAARVLERPVRGREPEDDDEADRRCCGAASSSGR